MRVPSVIIKDRRYEEVSILARRVLADLLDHDDSPAKYAEYGRTCVDLAIESWEDTYGQGQSQLSWELETIVAVVQRTMKRNIETLLLIHEFEEEGR